MSFKNLGSVVRSLFLGVGMATGLAGCSTISTPVCTYNDPGNCTRTYNNADVEYSVIKAENTILCKVKATYPEKSFAFEVVDVDCNGSFEIYQDWKMTEMGIPKITMMIRSPKTEEDFQTLDKLYDKEAFDELRSNLEKNEKLK